LPWYSSFRDFINELRTSSTNDFRGCREITPVFSGHTLPTLMAELNTKPESNAWKMNKTDNLTAKNLQSGEYGVDKGGCSLPFLAGKK
jgi:hypothetical protein